jgi:hypothetical protein
VDKPEDLEDMDAELARVRREADGVDVYRYRRRYRVLKAILLGAALAGLTSLIFAMVDGRKNPCELVRTYLCQKDPASMPCKSYASIVDDSTNEPSHEMRSQLRAQCQAKIDSLKQDEGVELK